MVDKRISELPAATVINTADEFELLQAGVNKKVAFNKIMPDALRIFYVSKTGSDSNDGKTLSRAFLTIKHAVNTLPVTAYTNPFWIIVAPGVYSEDAFTVPEGVTIWGPCAWVKMISDIGGFVTMKLRQGTRLKLLALEYGVPADNRFLLTLESLFFGDYPTCVEIDWIPKATRPYRGIVINSVSPDINVKVKDWWTGTAGAIPISNESIGAIIGRNLIFNIGIVHFQGNNIPFARQIQGSAHLTMILNVDAFVNEGGFTNTKAFQLQKGDIVFTCHNMSGCSGAYELTDFAAGNTARGKVDIFGSGTPTIGTTGLDEIRQEKKLITAIVSYFAFAAFNNDMPSDLTNPQITEGDEYMTITYTPRSSNSILRVTSMAWFTAKDIIDWTTSGLFIAGTADALSADTFYTFDTSGGPGIKHQHEIEYANTSLGAKTFSVRAGGKFGGTGHYTGFNNRNGPNTAKMNSFIRIEEIIRQ